MTLQRVAARGNPPGAAARSPANPPPANLSAPLSNVSPPAPVLTSRFISATNGTLRQARGTRLAPAASGPAKASPSERQLATARAFLQAHAGLLQLDNPAEELALDRSEPDGLGGRHLRFSQRLGPLPVWPATLSVHLDPRGRPDPRRRRLHFHPARSPRTTRHHLRRRHPARPRQHPRRHARRSRRSELIVFAPLDREPRLAWRFTLNVGFTQAWAFVVDALDGRLLQRADRILDANVAGRGTDLQGVPRNLNVWQANNTHFLINTHKQMFKPGSDPVQKPEGAITIADARNKEPNELQGSDVFLITSANPTSGTSPTGSAPPTTSPGPTTTSSPSTIGIHSMARAETSPPSFASAPNTTTPPGTETSD